MNLSPLMDRLKKAVRDLEQPEKKADERPKISPPILQDGIGPSWPYKKHEVINAGPAAPRVLQELKKPFSKLNFTIGKAK